MSDRAISYLLVFIACALFWVAVLNVLNRDVDAACGAQAAMQHDVCVLELTK